MTSSIGLVLGAGGVVGQAYHAGTLAALEQVKGWDPRTATTIVGTSAGSIAATLLRVGVAASDLAASATGDPLSSDGAELLGKVMPPATRPLPQPAFLDLLRPWRLPSVELITRVMRRPWAFRPDVAAMTLLPRGLIDIADRAKHLDSLVGTDWPEGLWICATRRDDGHTSYSGAPVPLRPHLLRQFWHRPRSRPISPPSRLAVSSISTAAFTLLRTRMFSENQSST